MKLRVIDPVLGGMLIAFVIGYLVSAGEAKKHPIIHEKVVVKEVVKEVPKECPKWYEIWRNR